MHKLHRSIKKARELKASLQRKRKFTLELLGSPNWRLQQYFKGEDILIEIKYKVYEVRKAVMVKMGIKRTINQRKDTSKSGNRKKNHRTNMKSQN